MKVTKYSYNETITQIFDYARTFWAAVNEKYIFMSMLSKPVMIEKPIEYCQC